MTRPSVRPLLVRERIRDRGYARRVAMRASLLVAAMLLALVLLVGLTVHSWRQQALERADTEAANLALAVTDSVARTVQLVDASLQLTARRLVEGGAVAGYLRDELAFAPHLRQLVVTDLDGRVLHDTSGRAGSHVDVAAYLERMRTLGPMLMIGPVHQGRFLGATDGSGQMVIPMARVVMDDAGRPVAVALAAINQHYFKAGFDALATGEGGRVALHLHDGTLLAATGGGHDWNPAAHAGAPPFSGALRHAEFGGFTTERPDGVQRVSAYRMTHLWPLVVTVGLSVETITDKWLADSMSMAIPAAVIGALLLLMAMALVRLLVQRAHEEEALAVAGRALVSVGEGITITDAQSGNEVVYANPAFEDISGYRLADVLGRNPRILHQDDRRQPGLDEIRSAIENCRPVTATLRNYRKDGTPFWAELTVTPVRDERGQVTHFVGIQRDITRQKDEEAEKHRLISELVAASAKLQRFAFVASHELLQPIVSVQGFAGLLPKLLPDPLDPDAAEALMELRAAAGRARQMVTGLREYFQLSASDEPFVEVDGEAMVRTVLAEISDTVTSLDATITVQKLPMVRANPTHLRLVWRKLLDNALKFRRPGTAPRVVVGARPSGGMWQFFVQDDGIGVPAERTEEIFDLLRRLNGNDYPGLGMGLPACRAIVERHGGRIWVQPGEPCGSVFMFTLPGAEAERAHSAAGDE